MIEQFEPKPWHIRDRLRRLDSEKRERIRGRLLTAYRSLVGEGILEADALKIAEKDAEIRFPDTADSSLKMIGEKTVQSALDDLVKQGILISRLQTVAFPLRTVEKRLYSEPQERGVQIIL